MKDMHKKAPEEVWENREFGASEVYVRRVSPERAEAVDGSLGLQMISLRLQKDLIEEFKNLAHDAGIGYQPYIRQLLTKYVQERKNEKQRKSARAKKIQLNNSVDNSLATAKKQKNRTLNKVSKSNVSQTAVVKRNTKLVAKQKKTAG